MDDQHSQPLAIDGGTPVRTMPWPHDAAPAPGDDADPAAALVDALVSWLDGAATVRLAGSLRAARAEALARATGGAPDGGEVALPDLCAGDWLEPIVAAGCTPVPVEVDAESAALSARGLARVIGPRTRAIVMVHPFGHPASVTELRTVSSLRELPIVEDASEALGASERGRAAGTLGDVAVLRLGDGGVDAERTALGALVWPAAGVAGGDAAGTAGPVAAPPAVDQDAARRALGWLRGERDALEARRRAAWELTFGLRGMRGASGMFHARRVRHAYASYVVRLRSLLWRRSLADTVAALRAEGVPCAPATGAPLHAAGHARSPGAVDTRVDPDRFPIAERLAGELLAIPLPAATTQREVDDVVAALRKLEAAWSAPSS